MIIKSIIEKNPLILAPMAGITNLPFRMLIKSQGCSFLCSEMVSSHGLAYKSQKTFDYLKSNDEDKLLSIQIFGSKPEIMAEAAKIVEDSGADILDINFGCSVKKIVKTGAGVALMKDINLAEKILSSVRKIVNIPLTLKIRTGWDNSGNDAYNILKIAQNCGVDALTIHPRTAKQGFSGKADWSLIKNIKSLSKIPIIGNGDILEPEDAVKMKDYTNCDAVMIGRAALENPWIFKQAFLLLEGKSYETISIEKRFEAMHQYLKNSIDHFGETKACRLMRSRLGWLSKGIPYSSIFRESIKNINSYNQALELIQKYKNKIINE